jgi:hypothetical protein
MPTSSINDPETYTVVVSGAVGKVYEGHFAKCAEMAFLEHVIASEHENKPESGQDVRFYVDGELVKERVGYLKRAATPKRPRLKRSKYFQED